MNKKYNIVTLLVLSVLVLSLILSGCTDKKDNNQENKTEPITDNSTLVEPIYAGSVVVGITQDLDTLDPHKAVAAGTKEVLFNIFEGLVKSDKDGNLIPAVASNYTMSEDGMTYNFNLREGVKFHNGNLVTVEDVIYSIERCAGKLNSDKPDGEVVIVPAFSNISSISSDGDGVIEIILEEPDTEFLGYLTVEIIPKDISMDNAPIGTGPFKFVSYSPMQNLVMTKNADYWDKGKPYLDEVTFKISANTDVAFMELKAGGIDIFPYLTDTQAAELGEIHRIEIGSMNMVQGLFLNNNFEPFKDERVRKALNFAVNREEIIDIVAGGRGHIIGTNMSPVFGKYYEALTETIYSYNIEKAKALLQEAGYEHGLEMTITVPSNYQYHIDTAQVIVEHLKKVNVTAKIELIEWSTWLSEVYSEKRNYESTIVGFTAKLVPGQILDRYQSDSPKNFLNYSNPNFDEIYKKAITEIDDAEKVKLYKELQTILTNDAASVYIQDPALMVAVNKKLRGYTFYPLYVQDMASVYFTEE